MGLQLQFAVLDHEYLCNLEYIALVEYRHARTHQVAQECKRTTFALKPSTAKSQYP